MTERDPELEGNDVEAVADQQIEDEFAPAAIDENDSTVGTGSSIALSCSLVMALLTVLLVAGLLIGRWLF